jgi:hypothetical protein
LPIELVSIICSLSQPIYTEHEQALAKAWYQQLAKAYAGRADRLAERRDTWYFANGWCPMDGGVAGFLLQETLEQL